jgi:hypothetical protein
VSHLSRFTFLARIGLVLAFVPRVAIAAPGPIDSEGASAGVLPAHRPIALQLLPGVPEIDPAALRDAVARELDAPPLDLGDVPRPAVTIFVGFDRARNEIVVARRDATGSVSRRVPLPADPAEALRATVFLIGNLARDEASEVLRDLGGAPPPAPASPSPLPALVPPPPRDEPRDAPARFWVGFAGDFDLVQVQSATEVCRLNQAAPGQMPVPPTPINTAGYYCVDDGGNDFPLRYGDPAGAMNASIQRNTSDRVAGGVAPGNIRAMVSFDFAATPNLLLGARLGYVANTYPGAAAKDEGKAFAALHAELRTTYVFGRAPLAEAGFAPYVMIAGGLAQWSAQVPVTVITDGTVTSSVVNAHAWEISGPAFGSVGTGVRWAVTPRLALTLGPRLNVAFGLTTLLSLGSELGIHFGF